MRLREATSSTWIGLSLVAFAALIAFLMPGAKRSVIAQAPRWCVAFVDLLDDVDRRKLDLSASCARGRLRV